MPVWNGDPAEFESFSIACRWYVKSLKENERKQAASRVWAKLTGPAKAVGKHLDPDSYESEDGLVRLLEVLRTSPLQQLPIPDVFQRLDRWHQLKRGPNESIPQLLVREEDLFTQLQTALVRARQDRGLQPPPTTEVQRGPPSTPSQSPMAGVTQVSARPSTPTPVAEPRPKGPELRDFFEDELRGYRLLKASRLSGQEKQNVLTQTNNSTAFHPVRRALRSLFAEEGTEQSGWRKPRIWWQEDEGHVEEIDEGWHWDSNDPGTEDAWYAAAWQEAYDAFWQDWQDSEDWSEQAWDYDDWTSFDDMPVDGESQDPVQRGLRSCRRNQQDFGGSS